MSNNLAQYTSVSSLSNYLSNGGVSYSQDNSYSDPSSGNYYLDNEATVTIEESNNFANIISDAITGIEGIPYQFMESVDRRLNGTKVGRKYAEKIFSRFPLLYITPCRPQFLAGFSREDKSTIISGLINGGIENLSELIEGTGQYYSVQFAYDEYYDYLNIMLHSLAKFLKMENVRVPNRFGGTTPLGTYDWRSEPGGEFRKTFFSTNENVVFYVDGFSQVSQSFNNDTEPSSLASVMNGLSDQVNEIKFLFNKDGGVLGSIVGFGEEMTTSITSTIGNLAGALGEGIIDSLASNGVNTVLNGGKIRFPEIWSNSSSDEGSSSFDFKFRSPDHDNLSIFLNVLKPYCKLLCLTMAQETKGANGKYDPSSYTSPFLVKGALKGKYHCDYGMISSMSVNKGSECQWNDDGLPTQIDVSIDIKNLYSALAISNGVIQAVNNTAYMDFIANMAGINIAQMYLARKAIMFNYLIQGQISNIPTRWGSKGAQAISRLMGNLFNLTS